MFVLIYRNPKTGEIEASAFASFNKAKVAMRSEVMRKAHEFGAECSPADGFYLNHTYVGGIGESGAQLFLDGDVERAQWWVIKEIPGAFIPKKACDGFMESIRAAADMYGDEERFDWFDADDICKDVCWELEEYLG